MKASIVELRYNMKEVLKALERNEPVTILYHGKVKGVLASTQVPNVKSVKNHPFWGMNKNENVTTDQDLLLEIRKPRYEDI